MKDSFLKYLTYEKGLSQNSITAYTTDVERWIAFIAPSTMATATHNDARAFVMTLVEEKQNPRSVNRRISALRTLYNYLLREGHTTLNPFSKIRSLKTPKNLANFVQPRQMEQLLEVHQNSLKMSYREVCNATILKLLYHTGLRRSELCGLKLADIDTQNRALRVIGKGSKERIVPLNTEIFEVVQIFLSKRSEICCKNEVEYVFLKKQRGEKEGYIGMNGNDIYRIVRAEMQGIVSGTRCSPHTLRHTFATDLMKGGVGIRDVQELLGHSSITSTQIYTHNTVAQLKSIYKSAHPRVTDRDKDE